jgi:hypothetical protein
VGGGGRERERERDPFPLLFDHHFFGSSLVDLNMIMEVMCEDLKSDVCVAMNV